MKGIRKVSTRGMSREEWLMQRRKTIGGSDAAGIVGLSKWASPFSVWAEKTGRTAEKEDTEAMRQGRGPPLDGGDGQTGPSAVSYSQSFSRPYLGRSILGRMESNKGVVCPLPCPQDGP